MEDELFELTNPQKSIWLTEQYYKNTPINNICGSFIIRECTDISLLKKAIKHFISNNDSFHIKFKLIDGKLMQYFDNTFENITFDLLELDSENQIDKYAKDMVDSHIDLLTSMPFTFKLFKLKNGFGGFIVNVHHIISDAATFSLIGAEIASAYSCFVAGKEPLTKTYSYKDYIYSEKEYLSNNRFDKDKNYWNNLLSPVPEIATIPVISKSEKDYASFKSNRTEYLLEDTVISKIKQYCIENKISMYNFLISIYSIYIGRINNQELFTLGTPILNRSTFAEKHTSGMFISTSLLKIDMTNNCRFSEFSKSISQTCMSMLRHQKYNYQYIIEDIRNIDSSIGNLYDIMLSYQITKAKDKNISLPYSTQWYGTSYIGNTLDIHFHDNNDSGNLLIEYDYLISKLSSQDISDIHNRILFIIEQVLNNDILINDIQIITAKEREQIVNDFNSNSLQTPNKSLIEIFKDTVAHNRNKVAIIYNSKKITYSELNYLSDILALQLQKENIQEQDVVGVYLERSIEFVISVLAILKLGAIYMPLSTSNPDDRLYYMITNSSCKLVITNTQLADNIKNINTSFYIFDNYNQHKSSFFLSNIPTFKKSDKIAYIIYTSGSTGTPKGVQITHKNLVNFVCAFTNHFIKINNNDNFMASTNVSFDVSIFELFLPLLNGAKLFLYTYEKVNDILDFTNFIMSNKITGLYIPPNILNEVYMILKKYNYNKINKLLVGVESIMKNTLNKYISLNPKIIIINGYGPTETTICASTLRYFEDITDNSVVSIGRPLANNQIYILNNNLQIQPIGIVGELCISGAGVGNGYINNPTENNLHFFENYFTNVPQLTYKTGDLARWNKDGTITFIGRKDSQIKFHGYRIELSEINNIIAQNPYVSSSIVTVMDINNKKSIVAYFCSRDKLSIDNLNLYLKGKLPFYMIPKYYVQLNNFPLTSNGKINYKLLPKPIINEQHIYSPPTNQIEKILCSIWSNLFNNDMISITDNFFELGGDSLTAIKFQAEALNYKINISYSDIFRYPTIQLLANKHIASNISYADYESNYLNFDYSNINRIISINKTKNIKLLHHSNPKNNNDQNILLLGSTGFLGTHILDAFLSNSSGIAYCIVRHKGSLDESERLRRTLNYYFGNKYDNLINSRIIVINGDIIYDNLKLSDDTYNMLGSKVDIVINSAALVKHYGDYKFFDEVNISGTNNIIKFCKKFSKKLFHVSTVSVSGIHLISDSMHHKQISFNETQLYIGQNLDNTYIYSKFEAEKSILSEIDNGLDACILRIGNISNRYSDAKFQINTLDNAYINRIRAFIELQSIPEDFINHFLEFSPVDFCADAIIKIVFDNPKFNVFHIFNTNLVSIKKFIKILNLLNYNLNIVSEQKFLEKIDTFLSDEKLKPKISGLIPDLDKNKKLNLISNVVPVAEFSTKYLNLLNFKWPKIDIDYFNKYIMYFKNIGYLD